MTNRSISAWLNPALLLAVAWSMTGCRAVGMVFKAGMWTAVIGVALLLALVFGAVRLFRRAT